MSTMKCILISQHIILLLSELELSFKVIVYDQGQFLQRALCIRSLVRVLFFNACNLILQPELLCCFYMQSENCSILLKCNLIQEDNLDFDQIASASYGIVRANFFENDEFFFN